MVMKKTSGNESKTHASKLKLKKETLRDLEGKARAGLVKGGIGQGTRTQPTKTTVGTAQISMCARGC
jgi:hypothetical protein